MSYCQKLRPVSRSFLLWASVTLALSGCADTSGAREKDRARYDALEAELIDAQAAEERRRQAEMRIADKLRQLDAERLETQRDRLASSERSSQSSSVNSGSPTVRVPPEVTQIVVAGVAGADDENIWTVQQIPSPIDGTPLCAVVSQPVVVLNGSLDTRVSIIVNNSSVLLRTDATFDKETPETGFRVDAGFPVAFDRFHNELTAVVDTRYAQLVRALKNGTTLSASFGYLPQLSSGETHVVEFTLDSFSSAMRQLNDCDATAPDTSINATPSES